MTSRAAFLDRDGTILVERGHVTDPGDLKVLPGALAAIASLRRAGWKILVVTNQSHVARGAIGLPQLEAIHAAFLRRLAEADAPVDGLYHCPHHPAGTVAAFARHCDCRKPRPGLLLRAAADHGVDLGRSFMVGDALRDLQAGRAAGVGATILVRTGHGHDTEGLAHGADHVADDLEAACSWVLQGDRPPWERTGETEKSADL